MGDVQKQEKKNEKYFHPSYFFSQTTRDPVTLGSAFAILRECVAARSLWRPTNLARLIELEATDVLAKALVRTMATQQQQQQQEQQQQQSGQTSDQALICAFWILSALATKGTYLFLKECKR